MRSTPSKLLPAPFTALMVGLLVHCSAALAITDPLSDAQRLMKQGHSPEALEKIDSYIASKPKDPQGPFLKGLILMEMGSPAEALAVFTKLNEDYPELPEPYNNLAVLYARQKQYEKARTALEMAIRADPGYAIARENLGDIYATLASQSYGQALQLDPSSKMTQTKLSRLSEFNAVASGANLGKQGQTMRTAAEPTGTAMTGTAPSKRSGPAAPAGAAAAATRPKAESRPVTVAETLPEKADQKPGEAAVETAGISSAALARDQVTLPRTPERGVDGGGWDLVFSPYTLHYNPDEDHKPVVMLGLNKALEGRWFAGGVAFSNSFGQPSAYIYAGQRYLSPFGLENWYLQWTAGILYGYVGEYEDKVPLNYKGFSPGFVPSIGYRFSKYVYGELDFLGAAALMFTIVAPLPHNWP